MPKRLNPSSKELEFNSQQTRTLLFPSLAEKGIFLYPALQFAEVRVNSTVCPQCQDLLEIVVMCHKCS